MEQGAEGSSDGGSKEVSAAGPKESSKEKVVFPPAPSWYKTNATASRDDMWAYLAGQSLVLVKPKITHTRIINPEGGVGESFGEDGKGYGSPGNDRVWPTFEVFGYQRELYSCISFCQAAWDFLPVTNSPLVTGCKEGFVRIWNVMTGQCVMCYDLHKSGDKNTTVTCLDWSVYDPKVIYSMDEEGTLVSFYIPKAKLKSTSFGKFIPTSLQASPHEANIVVFGTKGGVLFIAQTDPKGKSSVKILHKVRHDEEIVSTLWCPKLGWRMNRAESANPTEITGSLIASSIQSTKSPTIRLWNRKAEDRGIYHLWERERSSKPFRNFTPLAWITDPNSGSPLLVTGSKHGQIISYSQDSVIADIVHDVHQHNLIFGLVQCGDILWSTSYEPVIVGFNLRTMQVSCVIPTFKGVCAIAPSPSVQSFLAIGGADACIRVIDFNTDYPIKDPVKSPYISNRMRSKIMALAWHPKRDNLLGFGTDDGILGTFEVREGHKHVMTFDHRISGVVYAVDWGPNVYTREFQPHSDSSSNISDKKDIGNSLCLYACGGNSVHFIHPSKTSNPMINASKIIQAANRKNELLKGLGLESAAITVVSKASDIRWSPDFALFAVGYNDGRIELYTPPFLQLKCWIKCHARAIQFLSWRTSDFIQSQLTPEYKQRWFASTSNDATVRLFNLESLFEKSFLENDAEVPKLLITSQAKLSSPSDLRIISCAWSPHDPYLLVTVSYDSTAIIWNITDGVVGVPVARYFGHGHRLVACAFHPRNEYEVISASDEFMYDSTVHVWDYRDHPYSELLPDGKRPEQSNPVHIKGREQEDAEEKNAKELEEMEVAKTNTTVKDVSSRLHIMDNTVVKCMENIKSSAGKAHKGSKSRSLLPSTANAFTNEKLTLETELRYLIKTNKKDLEKSDGDPGSAANGKQCNGGSIKSAGENEADEDEDNADGSINKSMLHLGLLGSYGQCVDLLKAECESHASRGNWERGCLLASWMGDTDFIERAIDAGCVSETIVNLAKSMSKPVYKKACEKIAQKLVHQDEISKAVTYLLQGGWRKEAIDLLIEQKLFRDALALLVTTPSKTDGSRKIEILNMWLQQAVEDGNFEVAAKVYCSMGQYQDALTVIEKRDHPYAWKTGIFLADKCGDDKKLKLLGYKYSVDCIMKGMHKEAKEVTLEYKGLNWLAPFVLIHETIFNLANKLRDASNSGGELTCNEDFKNIIQNQLDVEGLKADGVLEIVKETVLVSMAQNKTDAEVILIKILLMKLLGDSKSDSEDDYFKLCNAWLQKGKEPYLHAVYACAFRSLSN